MLVQLPRELIAVHIMEKQLSPSERWRLRCSSKEFGLIYTANISCEMTVFFEYYLLMRVTFKNWNPILTSDTPFARQVKALMQERIPYGYTSAFFRWVKTNCVEIDAGGFYTPLKGNQRVRIGLWETGVRTEETRSQVPVRRPAWPKGKFLIATVTNRSKVPVPGFTVYTACLSSM